mmetsp:Transcript_4451/g.6878  ORF Transcript_4451/g.6878 Transcript_4451/m.6878 type:complete len:230 (-) Transcript_4451:504-1193(-)
MNSLTIADDEVASIADLGASLSQRQPPGPLRPRRLGWNDKGARHLEKRKLLIRVLLTNVRWHSSGRSYSLLLPPLLLLTLLVLLLLPLFSLLSLPGSVLSLPDLQALYDKAPVNVADVPFKAQFRELPFSVRPALNVHSRSDAVHTVAKLHSPDLLGPDVWQGGDNEVLGYQEVAVPLFEYLERLDDHLPASLRRLPDEAHVVQLLDPLLVGDQIAVQKHAHRSDGGNT